MNIDEALNSVDDASIFASLASEVLAQEVRRLRIVVKEKDAGIKFITGEYVRRTKEVIEFQKGVCDNTLRDEIKELHELLFKKKERIKELEEKICPNSVVSQEDFNAVVCRNDKLYEIIRHRGRIIEELRENRRADFEAILKKYFS